MSAFLNDMKKVFNTPAIPGIPNSKVGDIFGLGGYFGIGNPLLLEGGRSF